MTTPTLSPADTPVPDAPTLSHVKNTIIQYPLAVEYRYGQEPWAHCTWLEFCGGPPDELCDRIAIDLAARGISCVLPGNEAVPGGIYVRRANP